MRCQEFQSLHPTRGIYKPSRLPRLTIYKISCYKSWVDRYRCDLGIASSKFGWIQDISELGLSVSDPPAEHEARHSVAAIEFFERDTIPWVETETHGGGNEDAHVRREGFCRARQGRKEDFDEHGVGEVIYGELNFYQVVISEKYS